MADTSKRLTLEELSGCPEYQRLTQKQRLFVATYCMGGLVDGVYDPIFATRTAYECKTPETARVMSYALLANMRIIAALNRHFNTTPIEAFLASLDRAIANKKVTAAQVQALKLKSDILGYGRFPGQSPITEDALPTPKRSKTERPKPQPKKPPKPEPSPYGF